MPTGSQVAWITNQKLMGFEDWGLRFLDFLRTEIRESNKRSFNQGSFEERMPVSSPGANQVQIEFKPILGDGFCHDGAGNLLDLGAIDASERQVPFENANAELYEVGASFVEYPEDIRINPRTGKPEYDHYIQGVGREATPDSVTNNGTTLTFRVDALFEQGDVVGNQTGRIVRVWKIVPADSALTASIAIERCTVFYGGGENQITTAGVLGQTSPSTDPSDYIVQMVGITVFRNGADNRPSLTTDTTFFAGTVMGNGGTPTVFDYSGQSIIKAGSASDITVTPFTGAAPLSWNIAATDAQSAFEEFVSDLTSLTYGSKLVRVNGSAYSQQNPSTSLSWGGLGTTGDSVDAFLTIINQQIVRARQGITHSSSQATIQADTQGVDNIASTFFNETHLLKGAGDLVFGAGITDMEDDGIPVVRGESMNKTRLFVNSAVSAFNWYGVFEQLKLGATLASVFGDGGVFHLRDSVIAPNVFSLRPGTAMGSTSGALGQGQPQSMRGVYMPSSLTGAGTPNAFGFDVARDTTGAGVQLIENCVFNGSASGPALRVSGAPSLVDSAGNRVTRVFSNCLFYQGTANRNALEVASGASDVVFIGCAFINNGGITSTGFAVSVSSAINVRFIGCDIWTSTGWAASSSGESRSDRATAASVSFEGCRFSGSNTRRTTNAGNAFINSSFTSFTNCLFEIGPNAIRYKANSPDTAITNMTQGICERCEFRYRADAGATQIHGTTSFLFDDMIVNDCAFFIPNSFAVASGGLIPFDVVATVTLFSRCRGAGNMFDFRFTTTTTQADNEFNLIQLLESTLMDRCSILAGTANASSTGLPGVVTVGYHSRIRDWIVVGTTTPTGVKASFGFFHLNGNAAVAAGVLFDEGVGITDPTANPFKFSLTSPSTFLFMIAADACEIYGIHKDRYTPGSSETFSFLDILSGDGHSIRNNSIAMAALAVAGNSFVRMDGAGAAITVESNKFYREQGGVNPANTVWVNLTAGGGGTRSIIKNNILWNGNTTTPAVQIGANSLATTENLFVDSVNIPI